MRLVATNAPRCFVPDFRLGALEIVADGEIVAKLI
jgi:hypothetical protein